MHEANQSMHDNMSHPYEYICSAQSPLNV